MTYGKGATMKTKFDVIIVGGGMVGATLALALAQRTSLSICILEAKAQETLWSPQYYHHRVSAIALSSQRIFQSLNVWQIIKSMRVSPFTQIAVWDAKDNGQICFDCKEIAEPVLGHIIENNVIQSALLEKIKSYPKIKWISPIELSACRELEDGVELESADGHIFHANLAVAADGAQSWLRKKVNIDVDKEYYEQEGIVTTVQTEMPHEKIARQVFLDTGPLAFLPLDEANTSSIVWTLPTAKAKSILSLDDEKFSDVLTYAFSQKLGKVIKVDKRFAFPLNKQQVKKYVKPHIALIGDAAHMIHPMAGQGVNIGLLDAAALAEIIIDASEKRRDFACLATLRQYERWRKADNLMMVAGIDIIKNIFASDKKTITQLRTLGLNMANRVSLVRKVFARYAVGDRTNLPQLAHYTS